MFTDSSGGFGLTTYSCGANDPVVYVIAQGGAVGGNSNPGITLMSVLGPCSSLSGAPLLMVNEATTVASAYAFHPFLAVGGQLGASATNRAGLLLAESNLMSLVDLYAGTSPGSLLPANSSDPSPQIHSLANLLNACVASTGASSGGCSELYSNTVVNGSAPGNTLDAVLNLVTQPANNVAALYALSTTSSAYSNVLRAQPSDWVLFLTLSGAGMNAPTGIALDSVGQVWVSNLGGVVSQFSSVGAPIFTNGISGAYGLGVSFGIAIDTNDLAWVTNWYSPHSVNHGHGAVVVLGTSGGTVTTSAYYSSGVSYPTGAIVDTDDTVWMANYGNASVARLSSSGVALSGANGFGSSSIQFPVAVALDSQHNVWAANSSADTITKVSQDGTSINPVHCCNGPFGLAVDGGDNVWVANYFGNSLSLVSPSGQVVSNGGFTGAGLQSPNGIAIDGGGNVWVANYRGPSLSELAGSVSATPGAALSPDAGWGPDAGLAEAYGVAVDRTGSVWVTAFATNTVVKFIGMAVPVRTPLIGPVQAP